MSFFCPLKVHSVYSLGRGTSSVTSLIEHAKSLNIPAFALTDTHGLYGAFSFSMEAPSQGIQPIIACAFNFGDSDRNSLGVIQLYAKNEKGYHTLCRLLRLSTEPYEIAGVRHNAETPLLTYDMLEDHHEGIICLTGTAFPTIIKAKKDSVNWTKRFVHIFGDNLYIEICRTLQGGDLAVEDELFALAEGRKGSFYDSHGHCHDKLPVVATTDTWFSTDDRKSAHALMETVNAKTIITGTRDALDIQDTNITCLLSYEQMLEVFSDIPEAITNTVLIAQRCHFHLNKRSPILPPFPCKDGRDEADELRDMARRGLEKRLLTKREKQGVILSDETLTRYWDRLAFELNTIVDMGFPGYFLIVADFIHWAKMNDIPVGPGRGSGAGSLVAWSLTITDVDPMDYGLLFERFLNPQRVSMPDFDIDFCQDRRDEVIEYVGQRYGSDHVSMIGAFTKIGSKTALDDTNRVFTPHNGSRLGFHELGTIKELIPKKPGSADIMSLKMAYENAPEFQEAINRTDANKTLFHYAKQIEGLYRTQTVHAAGVIIGNRPLYELLPVTWNNKKNTPVSSFEMKGVESVGLVKFDFLGLKTLSIIQKAVNYINAHKSPDEQLDVAHIPTDDPLVFKAFSEGHTACVFQFESDGMRGVFRDIRPTRLEDLVAINALYRPGPQQFIPDYARVKNGQQEPDYPQPVDKTRLFLEETYGIMVYQEQVMQVAQACAGYSLGAADILRRAMGKKIHSEMVKQREIFLHGDETASPPIPGAVKLGMSVKDANALFDKIALFAGYGFNKSHAVAYAWIGYQTMWLKVHYPAEFLAAQMCYVAHEDVSLASVHEELKRLDIALLPPDVMISDPSFKPELYEGKMSVRFGFHGVKKLSGPNCDFRKERAIRPYSDMMDFYYRSGRFLSSDQLENIAQCGGFDSLCPNRRQALEIMKNANEQKKKKSLVAEQATLGDDSFTPHSYDHIQDWGNRIERERIAVGFYFNEHPIEKMIPKLLAAGVRRLSTWEQWKDDHDYVLIPEAKLCVIVDDVFVGTTRNGKPMIRVVASEKGCHYTMMVFQNRLNADFFDKVIQDFKNFQKTRSLIVVSAKIDSQSEGSRFINVHSYMDAEEFCRFPWSKLRLNCTENLLIKSLEEQNMPIDGPLDFALKEQAIVGVQPWVERMIHETAEKECDEHCGVTLYDDETHAEFLLGERIMLSDKFIQTLEINKISYYGYI